TITVAFAEFRRAVPNFRRLFFQISELFVRCDLTHRRAMQLDHLMHRRDVILRRRLRHAAAMRVTVAGEWSHRPRDPGALLVRFAGHNRSDGAANGAAFHAVVTVPVTHDERAEIGVAKSERAEDVGVLGYFLDRVT